MIPCAMDHDAPAVALVRLSRGCAALPSPVSIILPLCAQHIETLTPIEGMEVARLATKPNRRQKKMNLNDKELNAVLAGLRLLQVALQCGHRFPVSIRDILTSGDTTEPLTNIDGLCERLNLSAVRNNEPDNEAQPVEGAEILPPSPAEPEAGGAEIQAPELLPIVSAQPTVFLAGSIEMGAAEDWQTEAVRSLRARGFTVFNPRRRDWDSSWVQSIDNPHFREQVEWELHALERADRILLYFSPGTKSPISLLELGLFARSHKLTVVCPDGFWRKGNVDIVCRRYGIEQFATIDAAIEAMQPATSPPQDVSLGSFSDADIADEFWYRGLPHPANDEHEAALRELRAEHKEDREDWQDILKRVHLELTKFRDVEEAIRLLEMHIKAPPHDPACHPGVP